MKIRVKITTPGNMKYYGCEKGTIKEINLEDYIKCVVASEIGNASIEACKAQAVAARTYAAAKGVLDGKIISDDASKAQAFRAERNNYKNCNIATEETAGEVLMYGGRYINAYYCHSNGGRTYTSEEVWGGKRPYLVARKDDWTLASGIKKNGHVVGLSQAGCKYAGANGVSYRDILHFYYPYTTIKLIEIKQDTINYRKIIEDAKVTIIEALKKIKGML